MFMEAAQLDHRTNVMQAPKMTVFNGQTASISVGDELAFLDWSDVIHQSSIGHDLLMTIMPVVSADRRFLRLQLSPALQNLRPPGMPLLPFQQCVPQVFLDNGGPGQTTVFQALFQQQPCSVSIAVDTAMVIPDGATVLIGGLKTLVQGRSVPALPQKIPYLARLFRSTTWEARSLMILVTARIIVNEEEDQQFLGTLQRIPK
jgi:type II secretory pathway component GspD/PulD (secretin)